MDLIIKPTERCNFKCTFCSSTKIAEHKSDVLDHDYIYKFLKRFPETKTIIVNGGDPLMMEPNYYWKIIDHLEEHNYEATLSLTTNLWPFYKKPEKWKELFNHKRVGIATSFQYGGGRLKGDFSDFTEEDFWKCSDAMLEHCGYRPDFIAVIVPENAHTVIKTVELAKKMGVVAKVNYAMASGDQEKPFLKADIYKSYVEIYNAGLMEWEYNTKQMAVRLRREQTTCPLSRTCDSGIRAFNPGGDYYSCGAFGDDKDKPIDFDREMKGEFFTPLSSDMELSQMKQACLTCPMFQICNGCRKTIKDYKQHGLVEQHCKTMKTIAPEILKINDIDKEVTPYVDESIKVYND